MVSMTHGHTRRMTGTEAREDLAELLTRELGVPVTPRGLECAFARYWSRIALLAHAAHDNYEPLATAQEASNLLLPRHPSPRSDQ